MADNNTNIGILKQKVRKIMDERDWQQFHSPKNLSMSIAVEAAELMEIFLWIDNGQSLQILEKKRQNIEQEIADIAIGILNFCSRFNIDLSKVIEEKLVNLEKKYPIDKAKGSYLKYTEL